ncbi:MAG: pirin family protein [Elstera sp.]|jgi:redox-sensitive bicupin YhaK (pirin superfamily)
MLDYRPFDSLGRMDINWLSARYHFSFANYFDPARMGWGPLRVWNDDKIRPRTGFDPHPHRDMEIITYVRTGAISHQDNLGNKGRTEAGQVQVMSAGTGIQHAEYNLEDSDTTLFQIWIMPNGKGLKPNWETRTLPGVGDQGRLIPLASGQGIPDTMPINQDATLYVAHLSDDGKIEHTLAPGRKAYLVGFEGKVAVNGQELNARDGLAVDDLDLLTLEARGAGSLLLADLPG